MTTTTTAPEFFLAKCRNRHIARLSDAERVAARASWSCSKWGAMVCPTPDCNATSEFRPIKVRVTETECGPRCTSALGPSCDCKCGGENHAADHRR